jgi:hypothetical protein
MRSRMTDRTASRLAWVTFAFEGLLLTISLYAAIFLSEELGRTGSESLEYVVLAVSMFTFPVVGVMVASRHPRNAVGWILLAIGLTWELEVISLYTDYGYTNPGSLPRPDIAAALHGGLWVPAIGLMGTFLLLLFPNGRLPSPRWRPLAWASAIVLVLCTVVITVYPGPLTESGLPNVQNPLGIDALAPLVSGLAGLVLLIPLCIVGSVASLIGRFRASRGTERLQLKWLAAAAGIAAGLYLVAMITSIPFDWSTIETPLWITIIQNIALFSFVLIPIAVGVAILRHRLYDIDRIINRTLVYGAVTALLAMVYAIGVFGVGGIVLEATDQEGGRLAVAASTLAIAALFRPVRSRVQTFIDRRFYRSRYDAARTLEEFAARLRDQLDLDSLRGELLAAVDQTVHPAHATLWIRQSS